MALLGLTGGALAAPAQPPQGLVDMTGMVAHPKQLVDQVGEARQRPQLGLVAPVGGALEQRGLPLVQLLPRQPGLGPQGLLRAGDSRTALLPLVKPDPHRFVAHVQSSGDGSDALPFSEPRNGLFLECPPLLWTAFGIPTACSRSHEHDYSPSLDKSLRSCKDQ